jgi:iron complex transport system permease protein
VTAGTRLIYVSLGVASVVAVFVAACIGASHIPAGRVLGIVLHQGGGWESKVVLDVRLPRAIVAYLVGAALAVSGGALQGVFRNPLAEPGVLGVSNGAALGVVVAIFSGAAAHAPSAIPLAACAGAFAATAALVALAGRGGHFQIGPLLLSGVALANLAAAGTALFLSLALANYEVGRQIMLWLMGGFEGRTWAHVAMGTAPVLACVAIILGNARNLDALLLGDVAAEAVGVSATRVRFRLVLASAVLAGISVAIGGAIAFVGLIAPHIVRRLVGTSHVRLLPACFLGGGTFLVLGDIVARTLVAPEEIRLGVVTAAIGAPVFLWLLAQRRPREAS